MRVFLILFALILCGCETLPSEYRYAVGKSQVETIKTAEVDTKIRKVDNSGILYVRASKLGREVWLTSGEHKIILTCLRPLPSRLDIQHKTISLHVRPDHRYEIRSTVVSDDIKVSIQEMKER